MKTKTTLSVVYSSSVAVVSGFTFGLDLGDRQHHVCVMDVLKSYLKNAGGGIRQDFGIARQANICDDFSRRLIILNLSGQYH